MHIQKKSAEAEKSACWKTAFNQTKFCKVHHFADDTNFYFWVTLSKTEQTSQW